MTIIQVATLSFMQGFTELLPISSSGYMIIASWVLGWDPPSAAFDATVHLGSLLALALFLPTRLDADPAGRSGEIEPSRLVVTTT